MIQLEELYKKNGPTCINSSRNEVQVDKVVPDLAVVTVDQMRNRFDHTVLLKPSGKKQERKRELYFVLQAFDG